jgi:hypothetical protein
LQFNISIYLQNPASVTKEAVMNKFITMLEDLWVAIAFAEAGIYNGAEPDDHLPLYHDLVHDQSA